MRRLLSLVFVVPFIAGCQQAQDQIQNTGEQAYSSASKAIASGWASIQAESRQVTEKSSKEALESLKSKLVDLQAKAANMKAPSELGGVKLDSIEEQLAKVDAALNVKDLKAQLDDKVKQAAQLKENVGKTYDDVRAKLDQMDASYRDLRGKLDSAQQAYDSAAKRVGL